MENGKRQNDCFFVVMCVGEVIIYFNSSSAINEKQWTRWNHPIQYIKLALAVLFHKQKQEMLFFIYHN